MKKIDSTPTILETVPESFSEAIRMLFRQWSMCKTEYGKKIAPILLIKKPEEKAKAMKAEQFTNVVTMIETLLTEIGLFAYKIEKKFWPKMTQEDFAAFQEVKKVTSQKMWQILQWKPIEWWDWESFFLIFLDVANRIEQTSPINTLQESVQGKIARNATGIYFIPDRNK